jgi:RNA polymerase sigma-70 factor (ECF subfamily)
MAYEDLVRRHQDAALRTAGFVLAGEADAEDAVQDAFVKAYTSLGRFRVGSPFRPWILRIVANEARNRRRSAGRRAGLALLLARERRAALLSALNGLGEDDRLVLGYRYFLDLGEAEMAEALGIARGTVKSRLSRALGRLRVEIGARDEGRAVR